MNVNKLIVSPISKGFQTTQITNPDNHIVRQELLKVTKKIFGQPLTLPRKIAEKQAKEKAIPSFINRACYVGSSVNPSAKEDARVLGGVGIDFFG